MEYFIKKNEKNEFSLLKRENEKSKFEELSSNLKISDLEDGKWILIPSDFHKEIGRKCVSFSKFEKENKNNLLRLFPSKFSQNFGNSSKKNNSGLILSNEDIERINKGISLNQIISEKKLIDLKEKREYFQKRLEEIDIQIKDLNKSISPNKSKK